MKLAAIMLFATVTLLGCGSASNKNAAQSAPVQEEITTPEFSGDSAYIYVDRQVSFGPRVPNTGPHAACADWLASELERHGAAVSRQKAQVQAFDGTTLNITNIIGQYNPKASDRLLLLAHWDTRPWADKDSDAANHRKPVDGANDGGSGVGVLLEVARILNANPTEKGIDIVFLDAEDWGDYENDESWALGASYFAANPFKPGYKPSAAILLDMVGGKDAVFRKEYFSSRYAPALLGKVWSVAERSGYSDRFQNQPGGAITDDHVEMIKAGIPAIDIIEYTEEGFNPNWHTLSDNMENIDRETLKAVGQTVVNFLYLP